MTKIEEIKQAIAGLSPEQLTKFRAWFEDYDARLFDEKIARDAKTGKLDQQADEAIRAHREGRTREL